MKAWRSVQADLPDAQCALIADLVEPYSGNGAMGSPSVHDRRDVVSHNADRRS